MSVLDQWALDGASAGDYAVFAGFEKAIRWHSDRLMAAYYSLDINEQLALFAFVCGLLEVDDG